VDVDAYDAGVGAAIASERHELKQQWDPDNVFRLNHNIPPV
jgi:berberine-like enzyme